MCKMLIVEPDKATVDLMINALKSNYSNFDMELILHTDNYQNAIHICHHHYPDLAIVNIDQDGECYNAIEQMLTLPYKINIILLIDEGDSDLLRTTLRKRNERFILKPIIPENFITFITNCISEIEISKKDNSTIHTLAEKFQQFRPQIEHNIIHNLVMSPQTEVLTQDLKILDYTFCEGMIAIMPKNIKKVLLERTIQGFQEEDRRVIYSDYYNFMIIMIIKTQPFTSMERKNLKALIDEINAEKFILASGEIKHEITLLHKSYKEALHEFSAHYDFSQTSFFLHTMQNQVHYYVHRVFVNFLMINDTYVKTYLKELSSCFSVYDNQTKENLLSDFDLKLRQLIAHAFKIETEPSVKIFHLECVDEKDCLYDELLDLYNRISNPVRSLCYDVTHTQLRKILYFVLDNHTNKQLSLMDVSTKLHISTYYICKLFRLYTDFSFIDYLNDCRIEHATILLKTTRKIKDIAFEVGYQNTTYFGRVFKQKLGITPKEYQLQLNQQFML